MSNEPVEKQKTKQSVGGFEFYAALSAEDASDEAQPFRIKGLASTDMLDGHNSIVTEGAISRMAMLEKMPITVGADHADGKYNVLSIIGWAKPTVSRAQGEFLIEGYLKPDHPYAASLYADIRDYPDEMKLSIGGVVPPGGASRDYDKQSGSYVTYINEFNVDHIMVCRAGNAVNPSTWIQVVEGDTSSFVGRSFSDRHDWGKMITDAGSEVLDAETTKESVSTMAGNDDQKLGFIAGLGQTLSSLARGELVGRSESPPNKGTEEGSTGGVETPAPQEGAQDSKEAGKVADGKEPVDTPKDDAQAPEADQAQVAEQILAGVTTVVEKFGATLNESVADLNTRIAAMEETMSKDNKPEPNDDAKEPDVADDKEPVDAPKDDGDNKGAADDDAKSKGDAEEPKPAKDDTPSADEDIAKLVEDVVAAKYQGLEKSLDEHLNVIYGQIKEILNRLDLSMKSRGKSSQVPLAGEPASLQDTETTKRNSVATLISDTFSSGKQV